MKWLRYLQICNVGLLLLFALTPWESTIRLQAISLTATPFRSPTKLAMLLTHSSSTDLYTLDVPSSSLQLIAKNISDAYPAWSPDYKRIAFVQTTSSGDMQIAIVNADGSNRHPIYTISHHMLEDLHDEWLIHQIAWSPDGQQIAFDIRHSEDRTSSQMYIISMEGMLLHTLSGGDLFLFALKWLSNNREIAYELDNGQCWTLNILDVETQASHFLAGCSDFDEREQPATLAPCSSPQVGISGTYLDYAWSSDNQFLALALDQTSFCLPDIMIVRPGTHEIHALVLKAQKLTWMPDNKSIAYIEDTSNEALCVVSIDGSVNRCGLSMKDPATQYLTATQILGLPNDMILVVVSHNPEIGDDSQICEIKVDTFKKHCLPGIFSGTATFIN